MSEPLSAVDGPALLAALRRNDHDAIDRAYRFVFGNDLGRLVLAHHLAECGVGNALGAKGLKYAAGKHDGALLLALKAGIDNAAVSVAVLTDTLEETGHEGPSDFDYAALDEDDR